MNQTIIRTGDTPILQQNKIGDLEYLTFPMLTATRMVKHLFSTRLGGVSEDIFSTMNLSYTRGDNKVYVDENYRRIAQALNVDMADFVCSDQTHTTNIRQVTRADAGKGILYKKDYADVDGLITDEPGLVLATFYADCVPLFFVDPMHRAIGLSHSGWRGTVAGMAKRTVEEMNHAFGSRPEELVAAIGPSICQNCYEVSRDVAEEFMQVFPDQKRQEQVLKPGRPDKYQLNLWMANYYLMQEAGIPASQISVTDICTCCNSSYLFSHRASQGRRGNLGAFLCLKQP